MSFSLSLALIDFCVTLMRVELVTGSAMILKCTEQGLLTKSSAK
ncbi:hypothetical protein [Paenibacillus cremeus]|nr:hypothetical protein [Paenibacillus cremeus]